MGGSGHQHESLHGGTAVELGAHEFHLDITHDDSAGVLRAYVMDAHLQNFIRIPAKSFVLAARLPSGEAALTLEAVSSPTTGETVGDTSLFEVQTNALKRVAGFDAVLKELTIRGKTYTNVAFFVDKSSDGEIAKP